MMFAFLRDFRLHLLDRLENLALDNGNNAFEEEVHDLGCNCEVDDLLLKPLRIYLEGLRLDLAVPGETLRGDLKNIKIGHQHLGKWNVYKCRQKNRQVRYNEVDHEDLLDIGCLVR